MYVCMYVCMCVIFTGNERLWLQYLEKNSKQSLARSDAELRPRHCVGIDPYQVLGTIMKKVSD